MTLITCASTREIPSVELVAFSLSHGYTVDNAVADYARHYGVQPTKGWLWGSYLYVQKPEGK